MYVCIYRVQNVFLRCPTPRLHCFLSSHWPSFRFLSFMAFFIPSIQFFFGLPRDLFCFGIHFSNILGSLSSAVLWTCPYHVSWFCSISFIIVSSSPICCLIVTFLFLSFLDIKVRIFIWVKLLLYYKWKGFRNVIWFLEIITKPYSLLQKIADQDKYYW